MGAVRRRLWMQRDNFAQTDQAVDNYQISENCPQFVLWLSAPVGRCKSVPMKLLLRLGLVAIVTVTVFLVAGLLATWAPDRHGCKVSRRAMRHPRVSSPCKGCKCICATKVPVTTFAHRAPARHVGQLAHPWDGWAQQLSPSTG